MIYQLDKSVGKIVMALRDSKLLDESVVVFYSDNGGPTIGLHSTAASNYPLRGQKQSAWEGAIRTVGLVYSPKLPQSVVRNNLFYVADWLPTLKSIASANFEIDRKIDGLDQLNMLKTNKKVRNELITIDDVFGYSSFISDGYKLVNGSSSSGLFDRWLGTNDNANIVDTKTYAQNVLQSDVSKAIKSTLTVKKIESLRKSTIISCPQSKCNYDECDLLKGPCLFNLADDPCEQKNLANTRKLILNSMKKKLQERLLDLVPTRRKPSDPQCDPKYFDFTWNPWQPNSSI